MTFIPYSSDSKNSQLSITVDKMGRIYLNSALQKKMGCSGEEIHLYLFFESDTRRIGLAKEYPNASKVKPFKFDAERKYTQAKSFLIDNDIEYRDGAVQYFYDGTVGGIMAFKASKNEVRLVTTFSADKNGNLEMMT